eukprot:TRINITY_DN3662_c0_g1_i2.p2 TRINITY_DN3662_c0_g1~~TRINITY_DN3662_c0_g1_i2.p2  ORF type:complete len:279 (-),score=37.63 TRINITY_DN3662_c0_g1_i2:114-950(-)
MGSEDDLYRTGEIGYLMDGNLPNRCDMDKPLTPNSQGFVCAPNIAQQVHCVVLCIPASEVADQEQTTRLCEFRDFARARGIPVVIAVTQIDAYDQECLGGDIVDATEDEPEEILDARQVYRSERILGCMKQLSGSVGVPERDIFPMKNYSHEHSTSIPIDILGMRLIQAALRRSDGYVKETLDRNPKGNVTAACLGDLPEKARFSQGTPPPYAPEPTSASLPDRLSRLESVVFGPNHSVEPGGLVARVEGIETALGTQQDQSETSIPERIKVLETYLI